MGDSYFNHPLRIVFGLITMTVINCVFLYLIPIYWVGLITIILLDIFLWRLIDKRFKIYEAISCFFGALGGFAWIAWWDIIQVKSVIAGTFSVPVLGESLLMLGVLVITLVLGGLGFHYLLESGSDKLQTTEV